ncbi:MULTISPECIES: hypothetical protein [Salinibaculum]|uniref:hypothetical protein n=1 Tax=Salinibaculum TaxID=2732368 RepID=UPI0030CCBFD7
MPIDDRIEISKHLAATYAGGRYDDPWGRVQEYQRVLEYTAEHPNKGSAAVASALDLPRSRIRPWMESDSRPDPVRAIQTAEDYGWLDLSWNDEQFEGFNILVAWIFAGGSIATETYAPMFTVEEETMRCAYTALKRAGITDIDIENVDSEGRATDLRPGVDGVILGRFLAALGGPVGTKNAERDFALPSYLDEAPADVRMEFLRTYVWLRGTNPPKETRLAVQLAEQRDAAFRQQLKDLIEWAVPGSVRGDGTTFLLTPHAARVLDRPPELCHR